MIRIALALGDDVLLSSEGVDEAPTCATSISARLVELEKQSFPSLLVNLDLDSSPRTIWDQSILPRKGKTKISELHSRVSHTTSVPITNLPPSNARTPLNPHLLEHSL